MKERASDMANYAMLFKGVSPSTEGSQAILQNKLPAKSEAAARFAKQQMEDQLQRQLSSQILELAMGMGASHTATGQEQTTRAQQMLRSTGGANAATESEQFLHSVAAGTNDDAAARQQWTVQSMERNVTAAVKLAAARDSVMAAIRSEVHHYNRHKKGALAAQRVTRTALSAASLTPSLVGPVAQVFLFGELTATGGTEQDKLLKELYIDKRLESRVAVLTDLSHMAIYYHHVGLSTGNRLLTLASKNLLTSLVGREQAAPLLQ